MQLVLLGCTKGNNINLDMREECGRVLYLNVNVKWSNCHSTIKFTVTQN
jgi:hypothetical protein